jgi:hypothetical protein
MPCICVTVICGRVSKYVTNGSKTAVMDVIGLLCASLGSSTVLLHDTLGSRRACACSEAGFSSHNGDNEAYTTEEQRSVVRFFLWAKVLSAKDIHKEIFLFTVGSVYRVKRLTAWWHTFRWWWKGWNGGAEVAETTVTPLLYCGFRRTGNAMGHV